MTDTQAPDVVVTEADRLVGLLLDGVAEWHEEIGVSYVMPQHGALLRGMEKVAAIQSAKQARIEELEAEIRRLNAPADRFSQRMWGNIGGSNE